MGIALSQGGKFKYGQNMDYVINIIVNKNGGGIEENKYHNQETTGQLKLQMRDEIS